MAHWIEFLNEWMAIPISSRNGKITLVTQTTANRMKLRLPATDGRPAKPMWNKKLAVAAKARYEQAKRPDAPRRAARQVRPRNAIEANWINGPMFFDSRWFYIAVILAILCVGVLAKADDMGRELAELRAAVKTLQLKVSELETRNAVAQRLAKTGRSIIPINRTGAGSDNVMVLKICGNEWTVFGPGT